MSATRVAAVDCGTNSVRLLVAQARAGGELVELARRTQIVRLGEGVDRTGLLQPAALERTRTALAGYGAQIRELGADRVRVVATSATRDARNADAFRQLVLDTLGVPAEVISGEEEARLSFLGATRGLPEHARPPYLVVDIGGGSTEFVLGDAGADPTPGVSYAASVDVGSVRLTERHLPGDPPTPQQIADAEVDVAAALDSALDPVAPALPAATLVGVAGTVLTLAAVALRTRDPAVLHHARLTDAGVAEVTEALLAATQQQRLGMGVPPGRVDVIGAGAIILRAVMRRIGAASVVVSRHDILDGIAHTLLAI